MYSDTRPCKVCGSEVRLRAHGKDLVAEPDDTVDDRICTNSACPTNATDKGNDTPTP